MGFIPIYEPVLGEKEKEYVLDCVDSTWISSLGKYVERFEKEFASFSQASNGVAVANGTVALQLALAALKIGPGDEVLIPDLTFVATANAVKYMGAEPVLLPSEEATWNIDVTKIKQFITPKTKAIIPVHLYGHPCDMDPIMEIAQEHNLKVIEDAAEAHGAEYKGKKVGSFGDIACFSFYGNKIITTGEGGICLSNNSELADHMRFLKDHAMDPQKRYWHPEIGFNFRMTNIQAALGVAQLERIDSILAKKREHAKLYRDLLSEIPNITIQPEADYAKSVFWMHSALITEQFPRSRDDLAAYLKQNQIDSRPFFYPISSLPPYKRQTDETTGRLARQGINLPSATNLTDESIRTICSSIASAAAE